MRQLNIRVYGIVFNEKKQVLVADEYIRGGLYTKFPGGGLEPGEGTRDCLRRELNEELGADAEVGEHIYTTDFYQPSAFHKDHQIISIYYYASLLGPLNVPVRDSPFDFNEHQLKVDEQSGETETFRFIDWNEFSEEIVTLPIDKFVAKMIKNQRQ